MISFDQSATGNIANIQRYCTDDGDGIRTVVFLKGCPLKCIWCHNADFLSYDFEIAHYSNNCICCGECIRCCPVHAIRIEKNSISLDRTKCIKCGKCTELCLANALVKIGEKKTVKEILKEIKRDSLFYDKEGGVTISGGEPMAQFEFTYNIAKAVKNEQFSFALETSGFANTEYFSEIAPYCDCFLFDFKASSKMYRALTGVKNDIIIANLNVLCSDNANVVLRCPIIPGANLDDEFIDEIIALCRKYDSLRYVQLMPYHNKGIYKAKTIGLREQQEFSVPDKNILYDIAKRIRNKSGKKVVCNV